MNEVTENNDIMSSGNSRVVYWVVTSAGNRIFAGVKSKKDGLIRNYDVNDIEFSDIVNVERLADGSFYEKEPIPKINKSLLRDKMRDQEPFAYTLARARVILASDSDFEFDDAAKIISTMLKCNNVIDSKCSVKVTLFKYDVFDDSNLKIKCAASIKITRPSIFKNEICIFDGNATNKGVLVYDKKQRRSDKIADALRNSTALVQLVESLVNKSFPEEYKGDYTSCGKKASWGTKEIDTSAMGFFGG